MIYCIMHNSMIYSYNAWYAPYLCIRIIILFTHINRFIWEYAWYVIRMARFVCMSEYAMMDLAAAAGARATCMCRLWAGSWRTRTGATPCDGTDDYAPTRQSGAFLKLGS
jgi:hypothetical protein